MTSRSLVLVPQGWPLRIVCPVPDSVSRWLTGVSLSGSVIGTRRRNSPVVMVGRPVLRREVLVLSSATELWTLPRSGPLRAAYEWTCEVLGAAGLDTPPFPSDPAAYTVGTGEWVLKEYPSDDLSLDARLRLPLGSPAV